MDIVGPDDEFPSGIGVPDQPAQIFKVPRVAAVLHLDTGTAGMAGLETVPDVDPHVLDPMLHPGDVAFIMRPQKSTALLVHGGQDLPRGLIEGCEVGHACEL